MHRLVLVASVSLFVIRAAAAQEFPWPQEAPALADRVIAVYQEPDRATYLDNLYRLQIVAKHYAEAAKSLAELRGLRGNPAYLEDHVFARVKGDGVPVGDAFREVVGSLDDRTSALAIRTFQATERFLRADVDATLAGQKGKTTISLAAALALVRAQQIDDVARFLGPANASLIAEDDRQRYVLENDVAVKGGDGATVCAKIMRPRNPSGPLPALLEFTIYDYNDPSLALRGMRRTASNSYVSVVGYTRGKGCSPDQPVPYERDGADAARLIDWITKQSWSDGRVGMYGGSYSGFTAWAATKYMPKGLKAIMIGAAAAPAIDVPMKEAWSGTSSIRGPSTRPATSCSTTTRTTTRSGGGNSIAITTRAGAPIATSIKSTASQIHSSTAGSLTPRTTPTGRACCRIATSSAASTSRF